MALERQRVLYDGRVQGVGFRFTAARLAPRFGVSGWVRNLPDGRVELEAQGETEALRGFLDAIRGELGPKIHRADEASQTTDPDESPDEFEIRY
ncbi:MAG TPA: acylphosphatase [Isosphaeraceae bacterium]|jgi:acylphosphatase